jgi:hypothetical protein
MNYKIRTRPTRSALQDLSLKLKQIEMDKRVVSGTCLFFEDVPNEVIELVQLPGKRIFNKGIPQIEHAKDIYYCMSAIKRLREKGVIVNFGSPEALF